MQIKLIIIALSLHFLSGCVVLPFDYEKPVTPHIIGKVIDQETRAPVEGVIISLYGNNELSDDQLSSFRSSTNSDGVFILTPAYKKEEARVIFLVGDIFGQCTANIAANKQGYRFYSTSVSGPMKSTHFRSACDGIEDIHVVIELQPSQPSDS